MKVFVAGTRGIPNIMGGVEKHCEALYPALVSLGVDVVLARRVLYLESKRDQADEFQGVSVIDIYASRKKSLEAIIHTCLAILQAKRLGIKFIHIHAIGPSLMIPFARLLGMSVVMTHHGPDYDRQKWGRLAKAFLRRGEWCAAKFANEIIVISETINQIIMKKYGRHDAHLINNGVDFPEIAPTFEYVESLNLESKKYIIAVCRFVPEKGLHDLLEAYKRMNTHYKLVLVGDADHESKYSLGLKERAKDEGVVLTGFITGDKLNQIFSHAGLFAMPSYHEGLPIALLEALSYNLKVVVSDIPANKEVGLATEVYFPTGDVDLLRERIEQQLSSNYQPDYRKMVVEKYDWSRIAKQTLAVYESLVF